MATMQSDDVENILTSLGIERHRIVPTNILQKILRQKSKFSQFDSDISYFPLEWFDNGDGINDTRCSQYFSFCREGFAFLPSSSSSSSSSSLLLRSTENVSSKQQLHSTNYEWRKVSIRQYNNKSNKWHIEDDSGCSYEVPRIYLMFSVEDPLKFSIRIQRAIQKRDNCECYLRLEAVLNAFPMHRIPLPFVHHQDRIKKMLQHVTKTKDKEKQESEEVEDAIAADLIEFYQREYTIVYQKDLAAQQLIKFYPTDSNACWIELLGAASKRWKRWREENLEVEAEKRGKLKNLTMECLHTAVRCKKSQRRIQQLWLYCCPQSIKIMEFINNECEHVSRLSLFHLQTSSPLPCCWEKFHHENILKLHSMAEFLKAEWIDKIVNEIQYQLANVGKGWFELDVYGSSWSMYKMSKLQRLFELVKQRMQVAVGTLLKSSLQAYVNHLCQPCECLLQISDDFQWNVNDLLHSPFHTTNSPLFHVELNFIDATETPRLTYSIMDLEEGRVEKEIIEMLEQCVLTCHQIPQIDPYLIKRLKFDVKNLKLSSIGLLDSEIQNQIFHLKRCYSKCLIPLYAYARQYHKFIELKSLNVLQYVKQNFSENSSSAHQIQMEIRRQESLCYDIQASIPESIVIGPFLVDTRVLKESLIDKRMELVKSLKRLLLSKASEKIDGIQQRYDAIMNRLLEKPRTIEHLDDIAKWIPSLAHYIEQLTNEMNTMLTADFKCIESFAIALPDEIFTAKWKALRMPQIVSRQINETLKQHEYDIERFRKMQESDETVFVEKIDKIARDIDVHTQRCLIEDYRSISREIDSVWLELQEMLERGKLLNKRCEIFNQPEIDMERLNELEQRLLPYHNFWTATSNFLSSKEMWTEQMPLSKLNVQSIESEMRRYEEIVEASRKYFAHAGVEMMSVVERVSDEMREMMEFIDIVKDLINTDMHDKHWTILSERIGIEFEYDFSTTTLGELLTYDVLKRIDDIRNVSREATIEATLKREEQLRMAMEEEEKCRRDEEEKQRKLLRRLARTDIFN